MALLFIPVTSTEAKKNNGEDKEQTVESVLFNEKLTLFNSRFSSSYELIELSDQMGDVIGEVKKLKAKVERLEKENESLNDELNNLLQDDEPNTNTVASTSSDSDTNSKAEVKTKEKPKEKPAAKEVTSNGKTYEATFYTAFCPTGCTGVTATGLDVSTSIYTPEGLRVIAVDPNVIPLGTIVQVTLKDGTTFKAEAADVGGDIKGNRIDVLVESREEAYKLGRQNVDVEVIN